MNREQSNERQDARVGELSVRWDDSTMQSTYSNVCNVTGTREELVLLFGVNQAWQSDVKEIVVQLQNRIILSPHAAKRLNLLLTRVLRAYEERYGTLEADLSRQGGPAEKLTTD